MANIESYFPVAYSVQHDSFADLCFTTYFHYSNHTESASTVENSNSTIELPWEEFWCVWFPNFPSSCLAQIESESKAFKNITTAAMKIIRLLSNVVSTYQLYLTHYGQDDHGCHEIHAGSVYQIHVLDAAYEATVDVGPGAAH